nr:DUF2333 family protein [uncultured Gellertiella sp.]
MLDPIIAFFERVFRGMGHGFGLAVAWLLWPFLAAHGWYRGKSTLIRLPIAAFLLLVVGLYGYFVWQTQVWTNFDPDFVNRYRFSERHLSAGLEKLVAAGAAKTCQRSGVVDVVANLTDFNVNQNAWISSMVLYKLGLFGTDWDHTPFLDNKAAFQRGVNEAVRRTTVELVDTLVRMRGTSAINTALQSARSKLQYEETNWYFGLSPFGPLTPTPSQYRAAITDLRAFNTELENCIVTFDTRADNLLVFIDRVANSLGGTSAILKDRAEQHANGWFDTRADDRFWFAYGQLYGYYAILSGVRADFDQVLKERNLAPIFDETLKQFRSALAIQPAIISNGREDGWIMPNHLSTMGFYILRVRSNLVEIRSVIDR